MHHQNSKKFGHSSSGIDIIMTVAGGRIQISEHGNGMLSQVILEQSRNLKQSKLNKNVFIQLYIQYKINGFYDKARII